MGRACSTQGKKMIAYKILMGKPEETTSNIDAGGRIIFKWNLEK
jgi:hypothetical protein